MTTPTARTIGTAGHIDHGKTALVAALTGVDCDRLAEERERGITIELGFAPLDLDGERVGVVDVPGHERFVRTMLAGAAGVDVALLVVAADDGVMPQTREHVAILDLLGVRGGVIALTKCDLADEDWLELVTEDVRDLVRGTVLEDAPIVATSATTGAGIDPLRTALAGAVRAAARPARDEPFRLMIDRAFAVAGRGTVVTGTTWSGVVGDGDTLELLPSGRTVRVRGIQVHGADAPTSSRGQRTALVLAGVHHAEVARGAELATPGSIPTGPVCLVDVRCLASSPFPLRHRARVRLHLGTAEVMASLRLHAGTTIEPGERAAATIVAAEPIPATNGQPFVLRFESPVMTVGGGRILLGATRPVGRRRAAVRDALPGLASEQATERAAAALTARAAMRAGAPTTVADVRWWADARIDDAARPDVEAALRAGGAIVSVPREGGGAVDWPAATIDAIAVRLERMVARHHRASPLDLGLPRERLPGLVPDLDEMALECGVARSLARGVLRREGRFLVDASVRPGLSPREEAARDRLVSAFLEAGLAPPTPADAIGDAGRGIDLRAIVERCCAEGTLVHLGGGLHLHDEHAADLRARVRDALADGSALTMSELRQLLGTTRKYAVPYGEYLDRVGVTRRRGDVRVAGEMADGDDAS